MRKRVHLTEPNDAGSADSVLSLNVLKYEFTRTSMPDPDFNCDEDGVGATADAVRIDLTECSNNGDDEFGYYSIRTSDLHVDGVSDFAVSAPNAITLLVKSQPRYPSFLELNSSNLRTSIARYPKANTFPT